MSVPGFHRTPVNSQSPWRVICALKRLVSTRPSRKTIFPSSLSNARFQGVLRSSTRYMCASPCGHGQLALRWVTREIPDGGTVVIEHPDGRSWDPRNLPKRSQIVLVQLASRSSTKRGSPFKTGMTLQRFKVVRTSKCGCRLRKRPMKTRSSHRETHRQHHTNPRNIREGTHGGTNKSPRRPSQIFSLEVKQFDPEVCRAWKRFQPGRSLRGRGVIESTISPACQEAAVCIRKRESVYTGGMS